MARVQAQARVLVLELVRDQGQALGWAPVWGLGLVCWAWVPVKGLELALALGLAPARGWARREKAGSLADSLVGWSARAAARMAMGRAPAQGWERWGWALAWSGLRGRRPRRHSRPTPASWPSGGQA